MAARPLAAAKFSVLRRGLAPDEEGDLLEFGSRFGGP
jgi:hypothetical protein